MNAPLCIRARFQSFLSGKSKQPDYDARDWLRTVVFAPRNIRGFENIRNPWLCVQFVTILWVLFTKIIEPKPLKTFSEQLSKVESVYLIMFSTLGFLIVFRLTRAAVRFWDCSKRGGTWLFTVGARDALMVRAEEVQMDCNKSEEVTRQIVAADDCVAWCAAFAVSSKQFLRGIDALPKEELLGVLSEEDVNKLQKSPHQPMFCYSMMRRCSSRIYVTYRHSQKSEMREMHETIRDESGRSELSKYLQGLITQEGALERLRATKLPQIYVAHLRTLFDFVLLFDSVRIRDELGLGDNSSDCDCHVRVDGRGRCSHGMRNPFRCEQGEPFAHGSVLRNDCEFVRVVGAMGRRRTSEERIKRREKGNDHRRKHRRRVRANDCGGSKRRR